MCVCVWTLECTNVTSPPVLKLLDSQNIYFFQKILYVIPSTLLSFLPDYCHSFRIFVILSGFLSFPPNFVILSEFLSFLQNIVIPSELLQFQIFFSLNSSSTLPYPKGEKICRQSRPYLRVVSKFERYLNLLGFIFKNSNSIYF